MPQTKVLIIIINYKTSQLMQDLINSIAEEGIDISVIIVDNASTPETYDELALIQDERVSILTSAENLGFTGGINYALKHAVDNLRDIKYFFLLNPDAYCSPGVISNLVEILDANPDAGCISPKIVWPNGKTWYYGAEINYTKGTVSTSVNIDEKNVEKEYHEIDVFSGCAALFDLKKVINAGMFNENIFMYYDEADLSIKFKNLGYKILFAPKFNVFHNASYTTRNISFLKTYYMTRNKFMVFNGTMTLYRKIFFIFHEFAFHVKHKRLKNAFYHLKGFYDYVRNKKGAYLGKM